MTPGGRYTILVPQPGLKGWWKQTGDFPDVKEARAYARKAGIDAEEVVAPRPRTDWRVSPYDRTVPKIRGIPLTPLRAKVLEILRSLASPDGTVAVSHEQLAEIINGEGSSARQAIQALAEMGYVQKINTGTTKGRYQILPVASEAGGAEKTKPRAKPRDLRLAILAKLDELYALHPGGVPVQAIMRHFDAQYHDALEACRWLEYTQRARWVYRGGPGQQRKYLYPLGVKPPRQELSALQDKVLTALAQNAKDGIVRIGYRDIGRAAKINKNSVPIAIDALRTKGYIRLIDKGGSAGHNIAGGVPSTYAVSPEPTPENKEAAKSGKKSYITMDDLSKAAKSMRNEEYAAYERQFWEQSGIDPDKDLYSPEETAARMETMIRAAGRIPPKDAEERTLREQISRDIGGRGKGDDPVDP